MSERLVNCVHPNHSGSELVPANEIRCQTWKMPNGVCFKCCTNIRFSASRKDISAWSGEREEKCVGCPAEGE